MKKWSTLIFIVKKYTGPQSQGCDLNYRDSLASSDDNERFSPSDRSVKNIMDFARSYDVMESDSAGPIEIINN
ncbi:MAG: hypothetical protein ACOC10_06420 [Bacteroidota bacterium]